MCHDPRWKLEQSTRPATCLDKVRPIGCVLAIVAVTQQVWLQENLAARASACTAGSLASEVQSHVQSTRLLSGGWQITLVGKHLTWGAIGPGQRWRQPRPGSSAKPPCVTSGCRPLPWRTTPLLQALQRQPVNNNNDDNNNSN